MTKTTEVPDAPSQEPTAEKSRARMGVLSIIVAILFGLLYAFDLWEALSTLLELPAYYALVGLEPSDLPWPILIIGLLSPPIVYGIAFALGLRRNTLERALIFLVGLAVVASASLTLIFLEGFFRPALQVVGL
jgi:hypothetical protein